MKMENAVKDIYPERTSAIFIKDYLEQTDTILLKKADFEYLKKRAMSLDRIRSEIEAIDDETHTYVFGICKMMILRIIDKQMKEDI